MSSSLCAVNSNPQKSDDVRSQVAAVGVELVEILGKDARVQQNLSSLFIHILKREDFLNQCVSLDHFFPFTLHYTPSLTACGWPPPPWYFVAILIHSRVVASLQKAIEDPKILAAVSAFLRKVLQDDVCGCLA